MSEDGTPLNSSEVFERLNDPLEQGLMHSNIPARVIPIGFHWSGAQMAKISLTPE